MSSPPSPMHPPEAGGSWPGLWLVGVIVLGGVLALGLVRYFGGPASGREGETLVVYCAHDAVFAQAVFDRFTRETGIGVTPRYDSEATKSLGLTELLIAERDRPRADVFWNNQWLGTAELKARGVLTPYKGPSHARLPERWLDPEGCFAGFGGRLRVYLVHTPSLPANYEAIERLLRADPTRFAVAKPMFGTTLSHLALLWRAWGGEGVKAWRRGLLERGVLEGGGNAQTKNLVAQGVCHACWTDTDDAFEAVDAGRPVAMLPVRVPASPGASLGEGPVILIPNTVGMIRGTRRAEAAGRLIDFLLSEEVELMLARGPARQVPLGVVDESKLPAEVLPLRRWAEEAVDLRGAERARAEVLAWLRAERR